MKTYIMCNPRFSENLFVSTDEEEAKKLLAIVNSGVEQMKLICLDTEDERKKFLLSGGMIYEVAIVNGEAISATAVPTQEETIETVDEFTYVTVPAFSVEEAKEKALKKIRS